MKSVAEQEDDTRIKNMEDMIIICKLSGKNTKAALLRNNIRAAKLLKENKRIAGYYI